MNQSQMICRCNHRVWVSCYLEIRHALSSLRLRDEDELVDAAEVIEWLNTLEPGPELKLMKGVDHFFHGRLIELRDTVVEFLTGVMSP